MDRAKILILLAAVVFEIAADCPTGFVTHGTTCYHFSHDTETWIGALQMCRELESQLVEINDASENKFLKSSAKNLSTMFWIGLSDVREEGTWVWMTSHIPLTSTGFTDWSPGQPNNYQSDENCAVLYNGGSVTGHDIHWQWNDNSCHNNLHYICEKSDEGIEIIG